ncbi:D-alanyl-D-alanine carboxypeptidase/D-alanyl-D-alanine-endopeptidase [Ureibacillus terrenus]|uniref:D-alanyl-D-alanine carboxypeptidase/D-alanyl-D-alanine-endopeptidase n=2 Tax=Caryophanaceae TaxID=186818 RepID=A0A540V4T6_9BACL|nr:D-alanyl-D-alanine carboxypeptidase/D-alanyl-D-alanine-endopeptidase [Ureibacillus terrenus]
MEANEKRMKVAVMVKRNILLSTILFIFFYIHPIQAKTFDDAVDQYLGANGISVSIRDLETGDILYDRNGDAPMKPASTLKLLTAASALHSLGKDFRFKTAVFVDGKIVDHKLIGDLYFKGSGDPTFQKRNFSQIGDILKLLGVHTIKGNIYGDDFYFEGEALSPGVAKEDESYYYASRISALTMSPDRDYDAGTMIVHVIPTSVGMKPRIKFEPNDSGMVFVNEAKTVNAKEKNTIEIIRKYNSNEVVISGNIPLGAPHKDWVTLHDPTINTLIAFKKTLEEEGFAFEGTSIGRKAVPKSAKLLYTKQSMPLADLVNPFLKLSNNSIADILVKTMGKKELGKGDFENGLKVIREYGKDIGLNMEHWQFEDGSGISHKNRTTANELTNLLVKVRKEPFFPIFFNSLPFGGEKDREIGGSLRERYLEDHLKNRVIAKTGHISGVYTLAGYVTASSGKMYAFAVMTQNQTKNKIKDIDKAVEAIVEHY